MKNFNIIILALFLIGFATINSCNKEVAEQQNNEPEFIKNFGATTERDFLIEVIDEDSRPLANTNIQIGDFSGKTDLNGILLKKGARVYQKYAFIKASKSGYITGGRSLIPGTGTNKVTIQLMQGNLTGTVSSGKSGIVELSNGTKVEFDGAFEDANGKPYSGDVKVYMKLLTPSDKDIGTKMPGMLYGEREDGSESILETYGMISVELFGSSEQIIQPAKGHKAKITMPIDPSQTGIAPSSIPLWHFDEKYGYWKEEGSANRVGNEYKGEVAHFTWWNWDVYFPATTIHIKVTDQKDYPLSFASLELIRKNTNRGICHFLNDGGMASVLVPLNEILILKIKNICGDEIYSQNIGPFSKETTLSTIKLNIKIIAIKGILQNCSGDPINNGYIKLQEAGKNNMYFDVVNGQINASISVCKLGTYSLRGFDMANSQETKLFEGTFIEPITDFGTLTTCNSFDEYISYSLDGGPVIILKDSLSCIDEPDGFVIRWKNGADWFRVGGHKEAKTNGRFGLLRIGYMSPNINYSPAYMNVYSYINYGTSKGAFVDIDFSGTFADLADINHIQSLKGTVHVRRDN